MDNAGIEVLIFDLGNVLIDFDHTIAAKRISSFCDKSPQQIFDLFFASDITTIFEEGKIPASDFYLRVKEMLGLRLDYDSFVSIWNDIFFLSAKNRLLYSLINGLKGHYKTALISNINTLHYEYVKERFPVFGVFHKVFTSFEVGAIKPSHLIYKKSLEALGAKPESVFYTDDRVELVESARELGIKGFPFTSVEQLKKDLSASGVNVN